ncbi:DUF3164 family protein [Gynuella sp.]|uniref:DUF3164 family protein n=1 Tax=Gynuella sp. TaxID=2969146 RepID=UPI003D0BE4FE
MNNIIEGYMRNHRGCLVPENQIREQDKLRDATVSDLARKAIWLNEQLSSFKQQALNDIADLIQIAADKWQVDLAGKKGNITLTSFDGEYRIQRVYAERIVFTEEIAAAQALFVNCLNRWSEGANKYLRVAIDRSFRTNSNGQIKTSELLDLLRWEVDDPEWIKATDALKQSISVSGSTVYVRVYRRKPNTDEYQLINLDLAGV